MDFNLRVFVSSTSIDLLEYREATMRAIQGLGASGDDMIFWSADERDGATVSVDRVRVSDVLILILAHRYGYVPPGGSASVTELEFRAAREHGIPVLAFFVDEDVPWPPKHIERERLSDLARFRAMVEESVTRRTFRSPDELAALVTQALVALSARRSAEPRPQLVARGPALTVAVAAQLRWMPDAVVPVGRAEDGLPLLLRVKRSQDLVPLLSNLASAVSRPGVGLPAAMFKTFQQSIEQHSRAAWASDRIVPVRLRSGEQDEMFVTSSNLTRLFRPLLEALLSGQPPESSGGAARRRAAEPEHSTTAVLAYPASTESRTKTAKSLQSVGGQNRFLGIALSSGQMFSVGRSEEEWVEWRPFILESLTAHFPDSRFRLPQLMEEDVTPKQYELMLQVLAEHMARATADFPVRIQFLVTRQQLAGLVLRVAEAIARLHGQKMVHGDIKPGNVMLAEEGPHLIDAFDLEPGDRSPGWTPDWSAPEQILGDPVALATDVYPLGVMVVRVLNGTLVGEVRKFRAAPILSGRDEFDVFYDPHVYVDPSSPTAADLRPWLSFVRSCLRFSTNRRIPSAGAFAEGLRTLLKEQPLTGSLAISLSGRMVRATTIDGSVSVARVISDGPPTELPPSPTRAPDTLPDALDEDGG